MATVSPKLLYSKLPRVPWSLNDLLRRTPFLPSSARRSLSRTSYSLRRRLSPPARKLLSLLVFLFTIFYFFGLLSSRGSQHDGTHAAGRTTTRMSLLEANPWLKEGSDGSVTVEEGDWKKEHPIRVLMAEAKIIWENQLSRQSKTLEQAVETYKIRYGRSPPKGFEDWWKFTQRNKVLIVDDYDSIHASITPFLALNPKLLGDRLTDSISGYPYFYELQVRKNRPVKINGKEKNSPRAKEVADLVEGFRRYLPEDFGEGSGLFGKLDGDQGLMKISVSNHEFGSRIMGEEFRNRMMDLAERGKYIGEDVLKIMENTKRDGAWADGLLKACSWRSLADRRKLTNSTMFKLYDSNETSAVAAPISFTKDALKSYNFCHNPSIIPLHGTYAQDVVRSSGLEPQFVLNKIDQSPQILMASTVGFQNQTNGLLSWEEKSNGRLLFRGTTTGGSYRKENDFDWRDSHRVRLNTLADNPPTGALTDVLVEHTVGRFGGGNAVSMRRVDARDLNEHLFDVGITRVVQCDEDDGTCDEMDDEIVIVEDVSPQEALKYRYVLDVDGNRWSTGFRQLLALGQVVFKVSIYPEWNTEWLTPWLHYVPVNLDLSDLYHTSTFFLGAPGLSEENDTAARAISEAGQEFIKKCWRWEDLQAYMFRLLLEYRRAMARDRDAMSMGGKMLLS